MATNKRNYPNSYFGWYNDDDKLAIVWRTFTNDDDSDNTASRDVFDTYSSTTVPSGIRISYHGRYGTFGDVTQPNDPRRNPHLLTEDYYGFQDSGEGGGIPEEVGPVARQFTVNPFNIQDTLSRIGGSSPSSIEDQATLQRLLQGSSGLPQGQNFVPEATTIFQEQGDAALEDLLNRASNLPQLQEAADGGIVGLATGGNTPVFEGRVMGQGDGMADEVSFGVVPQTPADLPNTPDMALLSSDEYVMPADVVSMLGNGSSTAGSKMLDQFNQLLRKKAHGTNKQQTQLNAGKELSSLV